MNHFSELADLIEQGDNDTNPSGSQNVLGFAKGLKMKVVENKVKLDIRNSIMGIMTKKRDEREKLEVADSPEVSPTKRGEIDIHVNKNYAFNKTLEEETKQMSNIANEILRRKEYA